MKKINKHIGSDFDDFYNEHCKDSKENNMKKTIHYYIVKFLIRYLPALFDRYYTEYKYVYRYCRRK